MAHVASQEVGAGVGLARPKKASWGFVGGRATGATMLKAVNLDSSGQKAKQLRFSASSTTTSKEFRR